MTANGGVAANPLLESWDDLPFGLPPFGSIDASHFAPAFEVAMRDHRAEIDAIADNAAPADFDNTVAALDRSGVLFARIEAVFWHLVAAASTPALQAAQRELAAPLAAHEKAVYLNARLFQRIDDLHRRIDTLALDAESRRLLERVHTDFVRAGARLQGDARNRCAAIAERLAELSTRFAQNVLADENGYALPLQGEADLAGLPADVRLAAHQAGVERGLIGAGGDLVALADRAVPHLLDAARSARAGLARVGFARRVGRSVRQPRDGARAACTAPRVGGAARS